MVININLPAGGGERDDEEKTKDNLLEILDVDKLGGISRGYKDRELDALIKSHAADRLGNVPKDAETIVSLATKLHTNKKLPHTHAVLGGWGSGKTHLLTEVGKQARTKGFKVIYFNAFKYAAFMEIVPSLVYKILRALPPDSGNRKLLSQANELCSKHAPKIHKGLISGARTLRGASEFFRNVQSDRQLKKAIEFYGRVDKFHDTLVEALKDEEKPIFILIDELDRCDPLEAFEVIKQLRVLFCAIDVPLFFVMGTNPEPIGKAIQHKLGLDTISECETLGILEKFVDSSYKMPRDRQLSTFIQYLWESNGVDVTKHASMLFWWKGNSEVLELPPELANTRVYDNLRMMDKCLKSVVLKLPTTHLWAQWQIALIRTIDKEFSQSIKSVAPQLSRAVNLAMGSVIGVAAAKGLCNDITGTSRRAEEGWDPWDTYQSNLRRQIDIQGQTLKGQTPTEAQVILNKIIDRSDWFALVAQLCVLDITPAQIISAKPIQNQSMIAMIEEGEELISNFNRIVESG